MKTIWKFELPVTGRIMMPKGAQVLDIQTQRNNPYVWALVDPKAPKVNRTLSLYGTGHDVPDDPGTYIGTFQHGCLVFHVFESQGGRHV